MGCCKSAPKHSCPEDPHLEDPQQPLQSDAKVRPEISGIRVAGFGDEPEDVGIELESPTVSEIDAVRFPFESDIGDIPGNVGKATPSSKLLIAEGHADCGPQLQRRSPAPIAVHPPLQQAMMVQAEQTPVFPGCQAALPGAITTPRSAKTDTTAGSQGARRIRPRGSADAALKALGPDEGEGGAQRGQVEKAFAAFDDSSDEDAGGPGNHPLRKSASCRLEHALAALESPSTDMLPRCHMAKALAVLDASDDEGESAWPEWVDVKPATRVLLLTWVRWSKNSLRIKTEEKLKALQHVRRPRNRQPVEMGPLSPQPTPRESAVPREPLAGDLPQKHRGASRRPPQCEPASGSLFNSMRGAQTQAMDVQCTKVKLTRDLPGAGTARTGHRDTPSFGQDTPNPWSQANSNKSSVAPSVMGSGFNTPHMQGGQMSPWHMEAVGEQDPEEDGSATISPRPHGMWIGLPEHSEVDRAPSEEELATVEYEDELEQINMFTSALVAAPGSAIAADLASSSSCASQSPKLEKTRPAGSNLSGEMDLKPGIELCDHGPSCARQSKKSSSGTAGQTNAPLAFTPRTRAMEFKVGQAVKYWSSSHRSWLPARIVDRKSKSVYIIDKQRRGCMAKIRASDLIAEEEENHDRVLRAFAVLEQRPPQLPDQGSISREEHQSAVSYPKPAATQARGKAAGGVMQKPERKKAGRIVRDDFSDDSEDEKPHRPRSSRSRSPVAQKA